jgi:hypothetical protein
MSVMYYTPFNCHTRQKGKTRYFWQISLDESQFQILYYKEINSEIKTKRKLQADQPNPTEQLENLRKPPDKGSLKNCREKTEGKANHSNL